MEFSWSPALLALQREAEEVARTAVDGRPVREDSWVVGFSKSFSRELGERGWLGMTWPVGEGGHGRSPIERFVVAEALISNGAPIAASWIGDRQIGPVLLAFGTPEQRRRFLPGLVAGTATWSIGMSEPDAGSDVASLTTRARPDGGEFVIDGRKVWTSMAADADFCYVIARTDPDAPAHAGLSEFIVEMGSPGISISPIRDMTGDAHFCEVTFDGVRVPAGHLVGERDGSFRQVMRQLEHERGGIDRLVSNRGLFREVLSRADTTDPRVRDTAAAIEGAFRIGRQLVLREVLGQAPRSFSAATKVFCTELEQRVAAFMARVLGPETLLWNRAARAVCYAPAYTIQGGTSTILRTVIGERVLGLPRAPA